MFKQGGFLYFVGAVWVLLMIGKHLWKTTIEAIEDLCINFDALSIVKAIIVVLLIDVGVITFLYHFSFYLWD